eukprot:14389044-Alexandrium_andersonii.AAC.1
MAAAGSRALASSQGQQASAGSQDGQQVKSTPRPPRSAASQIRAQREASDQRARAALHLANLDQVRRESARVGRGPARDVLRDVRGTNRNWDQQDYRDLTRSTSFDWKACYL